MQPPRVKFNIDANHLELLILLHGLPPKGASCPKSNGYWVKIARDLCSKEKPTLQFTKAVANYYYCNLKGVKGISTLPVPPPINSSEHQRTEVNLL